MIAKARANQPKQLTFAPGARVVIRDEEWLVRGTEGTSTGGVAVRVIGLSELVRGRDAIFLTDLDAIEELRPENTTLVRDTSAKFRRSKLYLESLLRRTPPTDDRLHLGHHAAMQLAPYQLRPAHKALGQPRPRILIADGVGLGKTLEVGILLTELIQRGRGERILVVGLKAILAQFQQEMWARFTIPLVRLDSVGIQRVRANLPSNVNPFYHFPKVIISIDTLKNDARYRYYLEQCRWDAIVIDECQHVALRGSRSQRARLAQLLSRTSDALILTSATPHDGRAESFASLMNLLEPTAIADEKNYTKEDIKGLFVRRFKRDVAEEAGDAFTEREVRIERVTATTAEEIALAAIRKVELRTIGRARTGGMLFKTLLTKSLLSSPAACIETLENRIETIESKSKRSAEDKAHDTTEIRRLLELVRAVEPSGLAKLKRLKELLAEFGYSKTKKGERVVIFSERIATLRFLERTLADAFKLETLEDVEDSAEKKKKKKSAGDPQPEIALFYGALDDQKQQQLVRAFGTKDTRIKLLLGSDAAAEGINLHFFCHRMIHFDIPWSLITLEQRNGRIDRFGQQDTPDIRYLLTLPTDESLRGDLAVLERLIEKEAEAYKNIGDAAFLMKQYDAEKEEEQIARVLEGERTPEEVLPEIDEAIAGDDLFSLLMSESTTDHANEQLTSERLSLYESDLAFAKEAFQDLVQSDSDRIQPPEWHDHVDGFTLAMPEDLAVRYRALPPELTDSSKQIQLTTDRGRVEQALADARESEDKFPEWDLFWPQHPVAEWLNDRVLARFERHEAPVLDVPGLAKSRVAMIFQGIYSNRRSQPLLVRWFGVVFDPSTQDAVIEDLADLVEHSGLAAGGLANPKTKRSIDGLAEHIPFALDQAREYMRSVANRRRDELISQLKEQERRLRRWREAKIEHLDAELKRLSSRPTGIKAHEQKRLDQDRVEIEKRMEDRARWLKDGLETVDPAYLRLCAVLLGK